MGNVIMKAQQIVYGASNVKKALDDLNVSELIELNKRMAAIDDWKANVHEVTYTGSELTIDNALKLPARSLKTTIEAIQDLHGYDKPWVGGAGKNKLPSQTVIIYGQDNKYFKLSEDATLPAGTWTASYYNDSNSPSKIIINEIIDGAEVTIGSATINAKSRGSYTFLLTDSFTIRIGGRFEPAATITDSSVFKEFQLESGSSATSFAPYSNICPISGRTEVAVDDAGKNMLSTPYSLEDRNNVYYTLNTDGSFTLNGTSSGTYYAYIKNLSNPVALPVGTYTFSLRKDGVLGTGNLSARVRRYNHGVADDFNDFILNNGVVNVPIVNVDDVCAFFTSASSGTNCNGTYSPQIEEGTSASAFEPYAHSSATIQLGTTVYGADINWDTGVMTVTHVATSITGDNVSTISAQSAVDTEGGKCININITNAKYCGSGTGLSDIISDRLSVVSANGIYNNTTPNCISVNDAGGIVLRYAGAATVEAAIAALNANPVQACYKLATPTTIQLTPTQLQMLKGYNRVTLADGYGEIELKALVLGGDN